MRRFLRILTHAATFLSALLCLATIVLWVRGYRTIDRVTYTSARHLRAVSVRGVVFFDSLTLVREDANWRDPSVKPHRTPMTSATQWPAPYATANPWQWAPTPDSDAAFRKETRGSAAPSRVLPLVAAVDAPIQQTFDNVSGSLLIYRLVGHRLSIPCWLAVVATGLLPTCRATSRLRGWRRAHRNLCPACGYDLRATPQRCPECGAIPAASSS